jgi:hypothetical protein
MNDSLKNDNTNQNINVYDLTVVQGKIEPSQNSIKEIYIDSCLSEKCIYDGKKWTQCCKFKNCDKTENLTYDLCSEHYVLQKNTCIEGEKITRGSYRYIWNGTEFKLLCCVKFCDHIANSTTSKLCKYHLKNKPLFYSSNIAVYHIFNNIKSEYYIIKEKLKKIENGNK